jgi:hypothetical protein
VKPLERRSTGRSDPLIANAGVQHAQALRSTRRSDEWAARGFRRAPLAARRAGWQKWHVIRGIEVVFNDIAEIS